LGLLCENGRFCFGGFARLERRIAFQAREPPFEGAKEAKDYGSTFDLGRAVKEKEKRGLDKTLQVRAAEAAACVICLDMSVLPIQSGCACRGDAGLAHIECRVHV
jgi:hypothetical protein